MLKPKDALQRPTSPPAIARTRAYSAYGLPVIHGSETGTVAVGLVSLMPPSCRSSDERLSAKFSLVASWNS